MTGKSSQLTVPGWRGDGAERASIVTESESKVTCMGIYRHRGSKV